jgi:hypothetical protein
MKPLLFVSLIAIALTGCVKSAEQLEREQAAEAKECSFGGGIRQAVKNNWTYRDDIKKDYRACIAGNSNRDVVYNDTNELAKTCIESAHKLNGGVVANNWSGYTEGYLARVEKSLRDCGEIN